MTKEERDNVIQRELKIITALDAIENATREIRTQLMYLTDEVCKATRKDEPSNSEKPNNCEAKNYCDDCLYTDTCDSKEFFYACTSKATISKMEQVEDKPQTDNLATAIANEAYCRTCKHLLDEDCDCDIVFTGYEPKDEPQKIGYCNECKWFRDKQVCGRCRSKNLYAPNDEPQTDCAWR